MNQLHELPGLLARRSFMRILAITEEGLKDVVRAGEANDVQQREEATACHLRNIKGGGREG